MRGNRRLIALRVFLSTLGGAAFGVLGWAALATLTGALLAGVTFLAVTGLGALAGLGASAGFLLARPTHASRREWVWWALGLLPLGLFYGALLGVGEGSGRGLANRLGVVAVVVVLALAVVSAAILIGRSVALRRGGGAVSRGAVAVMAGVVCGGAAGLGFGLAELVTLQSVCQPHQYCLEPNPTFILQGGLLIGATLGLMVGAAAAVAVAASAARRADVDFQIPHTNGMAGA